MNKLSLILLISTLFSGPFIPNNNQAINHIQVFFRWPQIVGAIEYELKNVGHFNYREYFHKYPGYHPEHPNNDEEHAYGDDYEGHYWNDQYEDNIA